MKKYRKFNEILNRHLQKNRLSGEIPEEIGNLTCLIQLYVEIVLYFTFCTQLFVI